MEWNGTLVLKGWMNRIPICTMSMGRVAEDSNEVWQWHCNRPWEKHDEKYHENIHSNFLFEEYHGEQYGHQGIILQITALHTSCHNGDWHRSFPYRNFNGKNFKFIFSKTIKNVHYFSFFLFNSLVHCHMKSVPLPQSVRINNFVVSRTHICLQLCPKPWHHF